MYLVNLSTLATSRNGRTAPSLAWLGLDSIVAREQVRGGVKYLFSFIITQKCPDLYVSAPSKSQPDTALGFTAHISSLLAGNLIILLNTACYILS